MSKENFHLRVKQFYFQLYFNYKFCYDTIYRKFEFLCFWEKFRIDFMIQTFSLHKGLENTSYETHLRLDWVLLGAPWELLQVVPGLHCWPGWIPFVFSEHEDNSLSLRPFPQIFGRLRLEKEKETKKCLHVNSLPCLASPSSPFFLSQGLPY
jgi:hypothetical protein